MIDGHERERRIDRRVDDVEVEPVDARRSAPSRAEVAPPSGSTPRRSPRAADGVQVDDVAQILTYGRTKSFARGWWRRGARARTACARRPRCPPRRSSLARSWIQRVTSVSAGPPSGGLYLKPPSSGGLCDGVTTMPSARPAARPRLWTRIACEMTGVGVTPSSRWMIVSTPFAASTSSAVRSRRPGQRVGVLADVERPVDAAAAAVLADRLGGREDVRLVERPAQRGAAVAARAERDELVRVVGVGPARVVLALEPRDVDQHLRRRRLPREGRDGHGSPAAGRGPLHSASSEATRRCASSSASARMTSRAIISYHSATSAG